MTPDRSGSGVADLLPLAFVGVAFFALAALSTASAVASGAVGLIAMAAATGLKRSARPGLRWVAVAPLLAALGWASMLAAPGPVAGLWAAVAGIALLAWIGVDPRPERASARPGFGLLIPAVGVGIALAVAFVLPYGSGEQVGVAGGLVAAALALSGWLYATARRTTTEASPAS